MVAAVVLALSMGSGFPPVHAPLANQAKNARRQAKTLEERANGLSHIKKNGMSVSWRMVPVDGEDAAQKGARELEFTLSAPTQGWVFLGFSDGPGLDGARWIATRVRGGRAEAHERVTNFAWPAPFHRARVDVDKTNAVRLVRGEETSSQTTVVARLRIDDERAKGPNALIVRPGKTLYLHLAYSTSDDWHHHSRMRTRVKTKL